MSHIRTRLVVGAVAATTALVGSIVAVPVAASFSSDPVAALPGPDEATVVTVTPARVLDTRRSLGFEDPLDANTSEKIKVTGSVPVVNSAGDVTNQLVIPANATGALLNVTALGATEAGFMSVRPGTQSGTPSTSNLNFQPGTNFPNAVTVDLPTSGPNAGVIDIYYGAPSGNTVGVLVDIVGYTITSNLTELTQDVVETTENVGELTTNVTELTTDVVAVTDDLVDLTTDVVVIADDVVDVVADVVVVEDDVVTLTADVVDLTARVGSLEDGESNRTIVVGGDGTDAENGNALQDAVTVADAASAGDPFTIELEPGGYDMGSATLDLPDYVSMTGSGQGVSVIRSTAAEVMTVGTGGNVSDLTVISDHATATAGSVVQATGDGHILRRLTIIATAVNIAGIVLENASGVLIENVLVTVVHRAVHLIGTTSDVVVRVSEFVSSAQPALSIDGTGASVVVDGSKLRTGGGITVSAVAMAGGALTITHSTVVADLGGAVSSTTITPTFEMFHTHVDVVVPIPTSFLGTATCQGNSTPALFGPICDLLSI